MLYEHSKAKPRIFFQGRQMNFDVVIPRIAATWTFYGAAVVRQFELMGAYLQILQLRLVGLETS